MGKGESKIAQNCVTSFMDYPKSKRDLRIKSKFDWTTMDVFYAGSSALKKNFKNFIFEGTPNPNSDMLVQF
jgi:hypothetical protein